MKRIILALVVGGALFGAVLGFAASLGTIDADQLGSGDALVTSCDTDGVQVSWRTQVQDNADIHGHTGFQVIAVEISGINTACEGQHVLVSITKNGSHYMIGRGVVSGGAAIVDQWYVGGSWQAGGPMAIDVDDIHILIKENLVSYDG